MATASTRDESTVVDSVRPPLYEARHGGLLRVYVRQKAERAWRRWLLRGAWN